MTRNLRIFAPSNSQFRTLNPPNSASELGEFNLTTPSKPCFPIGAHPRHPLSLLLLGNQILPRIPKKTRSPLFPETKWTAQQSRFALLHPLPSSADSISEITSRARDLE